MFAEQGGKWFPEACSQILSIVCVLRANRISFGRCECMHTHEDGHNCKLRVIVFGVNTSSDTAYGRVK